jgi:tetratricopeptide (TPR) repeat protein
MAVFWGKPTSDKVWGPVVVLFMVTLACAKGPVSEPGTHLVVLAKKEMDRGRKLMQRGCENRALIHFHKAHEYAALVDDLTTVALSLNAIGTIHRVRGDWTQALSNYQEALKLLETLENPHDEVTVRCNLAAVLLELGEWRESEAALVHAAGLARERPLWLTRVWRIKGIAHLRQKEFSEAGIWLEKALANTRADDDANRAPVHFSLGLLQMEKRLYPEALHHFSKALEADRRLGDVRSIAEDLKAIGMILITMERIDEAVGFLNRSLKIFALLEDQRRIDAIMHRLATLPPEAAAGTVFTLGQVREWLNGQVSIRVCD